MYYTKEYLKRAHREIDTIFRVLFPEHGMAVREEQIMLCHEMLDNLLGRNIALCDAGVGIGKTYAYLVACVLMRKYSLLAEGCSPYEQRPIVISTSSITLQKAILTEYIPFLSRILQENGTIQAPIKAVIRKGKEHFVCDERLEQRIVAIEEKNKNALQKEALLSLKEHYDMDEVSNLSGFDRRMVSVPKFCSGDCPKRGSCRYQQYLERSRDHEMFIQICNHNYLLADGYHRLQDYRPLLKDYRALIVDEAHKLPDAAKQMFGKSLCYDDIREICFYLGKEYQGPEIRKLSGTIRMVLDIIGENHRTRYGIKEEFHMTEECAMYLCEGIQTMNKIIEKLEKKIPKWIRNKLEETRSVLEYFFHQDKKYVLHLKQDHDHRIILCASSRRIPQYLDQMLWSRGMGAILTSGTLKTGQGFSHIRKMTGLQRVRRVREYVADSPFEYQKNCLLYLPKNLKKSRRGSQEEAEMIAGHIHSLICSTYGHTLVLFTSYHLMGNVYQMLRDEIPFPMIEVWRHSPEGSVKYFFIRDMESLEIVLLPSKYLMHQVRANRSPNTIRRNAFALAYYWEYLLENEKKAEDIYEMDYETQYDYFAEYLKWLKAGKHTDNLENGPQNKTCNAYLKEVFRFYCFLEAVRNNGSYLSVLSYNQPITRANAIGVRRTLRSRSFKGYLKEEERDVRAAEKNEIITILEACTNCRDQVLILLTSELGFRIGEILGIDYTKDIDYETHEIRVNFREDNENDARAKNAEERRGRLSDDTFEFLLYYIGEYWDILQKQEYLFINIKGDTTGKPMKVDSVYDMFERMEKKTGIKITPHMLRRYYANTRWESDWPLEMISQALGHKHLDTTIRYLNVLDDKLRTASQEFYRRYSNLYNVNQFLESRR